MGLGVLGRMAYYMERRRNGPKAGGEKIHFWRSISPSFRLFFTAYFFCFLSSLARAHTCMLLFNQELGGSTHFLHDTHEFYEKERKMK